MKHPLDSSGSSFFLGSSDDDDLLFGTEFDDTIDGGAGRDSIFGDDGDDLLLGGANNDIIVGGRGDDTLNGGTGNDVLAGRSGADTFVIEGQNAGIDYITDFSHSEGDRIDMTYYNMDINELVSSTHVVGNGFIFIGQAVEGALVHGVLIQDGLSKIGEGELFLTSVIL